MKLRTVKTPLTNARGFTLLEVLIALVILSVGILATTKLQLSFMQSNSKARVITEGTAQVQAKIEELISLPYDDLVNGGPEDRGIYTFNWAVTPNNPVADTKTTLVTVTWLEKNVPKTVNYTFMKTDLFTGAEW